MALLVIVPSLACAAAAAAVGYGLRGRMVNDHPVCRGCGFDLFGKPAGSTLCAECGADLTRPRATRRGRRERRSRLILTGTPVLALCLAWFALLGWGTARGTDWNRHKPVWWLVRDARGRDPTLRDAALLELTGRFKAGAVSNEHFAAVLDIALDIQGDLWQPWSDAVAGVIGAARDAKQLTPEQRKRYVRQARPPQLKVQPELRRVDPLVLTLSLAPPRLAPGDAQIAFLDCVKLRVGEAEIFRFNDTLEGRLLEGARPEGKVESHGRVGSTLADLSNGSHTVRATVRWTVRNPAGVQGRSTLLDEELELAAPLSIVPDPATDSVASVKDRALRADVERSLAVTRLGVAPGPDWRGRPDLRPSPHLSLHVRAVDPVTDMAFRVVLRSGQREWDMGGFYLLKGRTRSAQLTADLADLPGFDATRVDVVLRPSADVAAWGYLREIWGDEVVIAGVTVDPPPRAPAAPAPSR